MALNKTKGGVNSLKTFVENNSYTILLVALSIVANIVLSANL